MEAPQAQQAQDEVLMVGFNQDGGCFACGTTNGFRVYNCEPFKEMFCRSFSNGGIGIVEMLFRCNILAVVGGGPAPKYPPTKVMIWDDHQGKCIGELSFRSQVRAVRLRRDRIVVALEHKVLVYNFADLKVLHQIDTCANMRGLVAISSTTAMSATADNTVLACPGYQTGQVRIELYDRKLTKFITAHTNALSSLCLTMDGKRLATASEKGTLVRVWNTADGQLLQELRRGADPAHIYSLAFSGGCEWLALTSDKGTVHVFALSAAVATHGATTSTAVPDQEAAAYKGGQQASPGQPAGSSSPASGGGGQRQNPTSMLSFVKGIMPSAIPLPKYFSSEWSFAQFRVHQPDPSGHTIVSFGPEPHTVTVVTSGGAFYKLCFDPVKGGQCSQLAYCNFLHDLHGAPHA